MTARDTSVERASYVARGAGAQAGAVPMTDARALYFERAMGFYSEELRQKYIDSSARIAGVGGGGLTLAVMLAKEGVADFSVADVEVVDETNVGRIPVLTPRHVGRSKADVAAELILEHNPEATVRVYRDGVQPENVDEFLRHPHPRQGLVVAYDEVEVREPVISRMLHRAARRLGVYVVSATDVERGGFVTTFAPHDERHTFEHFMGGTPSMTEDEFIAKVKGFSLPSIPNFPVAATRETLAAIEAGASLPTTLRSVLNVTDLAMDEHERLLTLGDRRFPQPHLYPRVHCVNPSRGEDFVTRVPHLRFAVRYARSRLLDRLGRNPKASYSQAARDSRHAFRVSLADSPGRN